MTLRRWFDLITTRGYKPKYQELRSRNQDADRTLAKLRQQLDKARQQKEHLAASLVERRHKILQQKDVLVALQRDKKLLLRELRKATLHRYGSYTPGIAAWEARWDRSPGRRILFYAFRDYAGSFVKWAEAINRHSEFAVRMVVFDRHEYEYDNDLVMPAPNLPRQGEIEIERLCEEADLIHIKDEHGFFTGANELPSDLFEKHGKPLIFTHCGGYARKYCEDPKYRTFVQKRFRARVAMTPDLNYDWFDGVFIPHAIDSDHCPYSWTIGRRLAHSPSTAERKGTADLLAAVDGLEVEFDLISGVPHEECLRRKRQANLFFDQAGREIEQRLGTSAIVGWYGNSALEAAVYGIPTIAHLSDQAFQGAARAGKDIRERCAIINTPLGKDAVRATLERYLALSSEDQVALSLTTRRWVEEFHSYEVCAHELAKLYRSLLPASATATAA